MSYVAKNPEQYLGKFVGDGECVALVKVSAGAPQTSVWKEGKAVKDVPTLARGTAIATFVGGKYPQDGNTGKHAAIFLKHGVDNNVPGLYVLDQWAQRPTRPAQPVSQRFLTYDPTRGPSNDAGGFSVIE